MGLSAAEKDMLQAHQNMLAHLSDLGCSDGNCVFSLWPKGMATNGGCHCLERDLNLSVKHYIRHTSLQMRQLARDYVSNLRVDPRLMAHASTAQWIYDAGLGRVPLWVVEYRLEVLSAACDGFMRQNEMSSKEHKRNFSLNNDKLKAIVSQWRLLETSARSFLHLGRRWW